MKYSFVLLTLSLALLLSACAGANGSAAGNNNGAVFGSDIFKMPFP